MKVDENLIKKYSKTGPRYTSYPPATFFDENFSNFDFEKKIIQSNDENPQNISVYIHIPFCPQICHFCGCTTESGFTKPFLERYVDAVIKEITYVSKLINKNRKLTQIHWGGGTPNAISYKYIERITNKLYEVFDFSQNYEMAIECNPAHLEFRHIELLKKFGFNRISVGIQDFRDDVLNAINRKPSKHPVDDIIKKIKDEGFTGTNIDLVYGLPLQTVDSFKKTVEKAIDLNTERIVTFSYAHVPSVLPRQKILEKIGCKIKTVNLKYTSLGVSAYQVVAPAECSSNLSRFDGVRYGHRSDNSSDLENLYRESRSEGFGKEVKRRILVGTYALSAGYYDAYYLKAQKVRNLIANDFRDAFDQVDLIIGPTTPDKAFKIGEKMNDPIAMYLSDVYTVSTNLAGLPAMSIPMGFKENMPLGLQIIGNHFDEKNILKISHLYQQETDWHKREPGK